MLQPRGQPIHHPELREVESRSQLQAHWRYSANACEK